jgi:SPP1 family predicted phage head-tail adaptor
VFTTDDLASMRETINESLPDTCTIQSKTITSDGMGGQTEAYATTATNVPCRVKADNIRVAEQIAQGAVKVVQTFTFTLAFDRAIARTDRIVWNARTFEVVTSLDNSWQLHKRVTCAEVA